MERSVSFALVIFDDHNELFKIIKVKPKQVKVISLVNPRHHGVIFLVRSEWKFAGEYPAQFYPKVLLTYVWEIDIQILNCLDDPSLAAICSVNKYTHSLCQDDTLWKARVKERYPDLQYGRESGESWKHFYKILTKVSDMDINKLLRYERFKFLERFPDKLNTDLANEATCNGQIRMLDWLEQLTPCIHPNCNGARLAISNGKIESLEWIYQRGYRFSSFSANLAAGEGQIKVLEWFKDRIGVEPDFRGIGTSVCHGYLDVLKWAANQGLDVINQSIADIAVQCGKTDILEWLLQQDSSAVPYQINVNLAAERGHINVLDWVEQKRKLGYGIPLPNEDCIELLVRRERIDVLNWLDQRGLAPKEEVAKVARLFWVKSMM